MKQLIIIFIGFLLIQCSRDQGKKSETNATEPLTIVKDTKLEMWREIITKEPFTINVNELSNPFISPRIHSELAEKDQAIQLELVGIVEKDGRRVALLQDSLRKGYIVKAGDRLGESRIIKIGKNYIIIEEPTIDATGKKVFRRRTISLQKE